MFFLGNNDILGYATTGGSGAIPMTSVENFTTQYNGAIATLLGNLPTAKGVVGNIPDVTAIPFFFTVRWNPIPLDAATATQLTGALANPYNGFLAAMVGNGIITQAEADKRRLTFSASLNNPITIVDETLTDLTPYMQGEAAALLPYARARQTKNTDLVTLSAGAVLGTLVSNNPQLINGVTVPMGDQFILIPEEIQEIKDRTAAFNAIISAAVAGSNNRLALADVNSVFNQFVANPQSFIPQTGILLLPTISPPFAAFSEDGVHPNGRGSAFLANVFIDAINAKFGATIPKADVTKYSGTRTPLTINSTY
jgi:phospholipase/lecithinase/hemolysin